MSDRQGSVRTGSRAGDPAPQDTAAGESVPAAQSKKATQSVPATGTQRAAQESSAAPGATTGATTAAVPATPVGTSGQAGAADQTGGPAAAAAAGTGAAGSPAAARATSTTAPAGTTDSAATNAAGGKSRGPVKAGGRGPRRARLQLRHIDTWSALKISLVLSIALFFIWMVAVGVLYLVLSALGVFDTLNDLFGQLGSASGSKSSGDVVTPGVVFGGAAVIGAINIVLMTALCTVGTFIYNLCSDLVGGLELTLSERD
jgi:hypothetical protein